MHISNHQADYSLSNSSAEILRIYEKKYGVDSKKVVDALGNVAAVANRIQNK